MAAFIAPGHGALRDSVSFQRKSLAVGDGAGNYEAAYKTIASGVRGWIAPLSGGDTLLAGKLQGTGAFEFTCLASSRTLAITTADRLVDRSGTLYESTFIASPDPTRRWLVMTLTSGVA